MAWYDKLLFWRNKEHSGNYKKIVAIRGEAQPGFLHVDICEYLPSGEPSGAGGESLQLPIPQAFRPTANRILCGQETEEDKAVLELHLAKYL